MSDPVPRRRGFINYPHPRQGYEKHPSRRAPSFPALSRRTDSRVDQPCRTRTRDSHPRLCEAFRLSLPPSCQFRAVQIPSIDANRGYRLELFGFLRKSVWKNAGFGNIRPIRFQIEDYEPRFNPTVSPIAQPDDVKDAIAAESSLPPAPKIPLKYHSVAEYHALFLKGDLTPLDVAEALLPLIKRDASPPGEHSTAWFYTKEAEILKAARESTQRYKENKPLSKLDGVPTAVKDEYEMNGYETCLGSKNDYTQKNDKGEVVSTWCVQKLEEAGAIICGKLSMHEFGLGTLQALLTISCAGLTKNA